MSVEAERRTRLFGTHVRLLVGPSVESGEPDPALTALALEAFLRMVHDRLSRFDPNSELAGLNGDPAERVEVSALLASAIRAALAAAERTGGLVDPTLTEGLEGVGYATSRAGLRPAPLAEALAAAPLRRPARPSPERRWARVSVDDDVVSRPRGLRLDLGGVGKGLAADLAAERLADRGTFAVDLGGDLRIGGTRPVARTVEVGDPFAGDESPVATFEVEAGAVATSGLGTRIWRHEGGFAHHLINPATARPAWTGVIQATAIADSALVAETIARAAVLSGPAAGLDLLEPGGGALILDDGSVRCAGRLQEPVVA